ncbi:WD repeat-containing protein 46 [Astathelohania contejeani]|uniref:WD repeat-containing protein 46 n=1 Tax=Astathelohania contejeani TaxID=164912 RepID=A0ABQ7HWE4_9MICR|nr:WD repeat-containing protein 46 [Thelohania contejeani]
MVLMKKKVKNNEILYSKAHKDAVAASILSTKEPGFLEAESDENTCDITQGKIKRCVELATAEKAFDLKLEKGPYRPCYTRNGRHMTISTSGGYLSSFDVKSLKLHFEIEINEQIFDSTFLHNELYIAATQPTGLYIYDNTGAEIHCVREHKGACKMSFLPYHFLLTTLTPNGILRYHDTSIGKLVSKIHTNKFKTNALTQNPVNAIIHVGDGKGMVTLWAPSCKEYLAIINCHNGKIHGMEIDRTGTYMVTHGQDGKIKTWDIRKTYAPLRTLKASHRSIALSQTGMLAVGKGRQVEIWKDLFQEEPYMRHYNTTGHVENLVFCPHEDILTLGHSNGISNIIVPGSGDPNFDAHEDTPFQTKKQRREAEVKKLLEKIPYDMIGLESVIKIN